jgi:hypothetical protein
MLLSIGGVIASLDSEKSSLSWTMTLKYFVTFCIWLPWVTFVLGRYVSLRRIQILFIAGLALVAIMTLSDVTAGTRFGVWLVWNKSAGSLQNLAQLRYGGPTGHPTTLGYVAAIGFLLSLPYVMGQANWRSSVLGICCLMLFGAALLVSGSRAPLVGIAGGSVTMALLGPRGGVRRLFVVTAAGIALLVVVSQVHALGRFLRVDPLQRLEESLQPRRDFEADWERKRDLKSAAVLLSHDPVTGYGMENVGTSPTQTIGFDLHNTVLQSWVAGGALAGIGTVWLYATVLLAGWKSVRAGEPLALALLGACIAFTTMDMFPPHLYMRFKWFAGALLIATLHRARAAPDFDEGSRSVARR